MGQFRTISGNTRLEYPIKVTERPMAYKDVDPSEGYPNQGWPD